MEISIPIKMDSCNSYPTGALDVRCGTIRPQNVVITLTEPERQIEVNLQDLYRALKAMRSEDGKGGKL